MRISDWSSDVCSSDLLQPANSVTRARGDVSPVSSDDADPERLESRPYPYADSRALSTGIMLPVLSTPFMPQSKNRCSEALDPGSQLDLPGPGAAVLAMQIGRAHVRTPVTNAHLVCRLLLE